MKQYYRVHRGQTLIIVALSLLVLLGFVALGIDGGSALLQRRHVQDGADAAALGVINLLEHNVAVTCLPDPNNCHPTYADLTNGMVRDRIAQLVDANHGDTVGAAGYPAPVLEYHFMAGAPICPVAGQPCYVTATTAAYPDADPPPPYADGVRISTSVDNPTTFARAINIQSITVGAQAAGRLYGTCPTQAAQGSALPMLRFRPSVEDQLAQYGNDRCHPVELWNSQGDLGGFDNLYSMDTQSFQGTGAPALLTALDNRNGPPPPPNGLTAYGAHGTCTQQNQGACADMRGQHSSSPSSGKGDIANWIYLQWAGQISLTRTWDRSNETWYPANRSNDGGRQGSATPRQGDWAEVYPHGNWGNNVNEPLHDMADENGVTTPWSGGALNWGKAITKTLYLWGPETLPNHATDDTSAQQWVSNVQIPGCNPHGGQDCKYTGWEDLTLTGQGSGNYSISGNVDRVRFTALYQIRIYANLQANKYHPNAPPECASQGGWQWNGGSSNAYGLIINEVVPGPGGDGTPCGWMTGGGVYGRSIDPNDP